MYRNKKGVVAAPYTGKTTLANLYFNIVLDVDSFYDSYSIKKYKPGLYGVPQDAPWTTFNALKFNQISINLKKFTEEYHDWKILLVHSDEDLKLLDIPIYGYYYGNEPPQGLSERWYGWYQAKTNPIFKYVDPINFHSIIKALI